MIALGFLFLLLIGALILSVTGAGPSVGITEILVVSLVFVVFFMSGIYVAAALGVLGLLADLAFSGRSLFLSYGEVIWGASSTFLFVAVPLFILMGELLLRSGLSDRLYRAMNNWVGNLPGGLLHTNIACCAVFAAVSGSSVATAATIGSVALPYFEKTDYNPRMVLGSLAGGGALGILIPPSITLIIYALFTETSVGKLYAAGFVAGIMTTALLMLYILIYSLLRPTKQTKVEIPWRARVASLVDLGPTLILILLVLGSMYLGFSTPTEAAAIGVVGALLLSAANRRLNVSMLHTCVRSTAQTTGMLGLIIASAYVLNFVLSKLQLPQMMASMVTHLALPPVAVMAVIVLFYVALGTFMDGFSMMVTTLPVIFPIVTAIGFNPIWFGIVMVMLVEMALISPPDGQVMYVLQGLRRSGPITDIFVGVLPFLGIYFLSIIILMTFPSMLPGLT